MTTQVPKLLRVHQVAALTGLERWRIYELIKSGKGPPFLRIGRTLRIPEDQLVRWIEEQATTTAEEETREM